MRIPLNFDSGEAVYFGMPLKKWLYALIPGVVLFLIVHFILEIIGFSAGIVRIIVEAAVLVIGLFAGIVLTVTGYNPIDIAKDFLLWFRRRRKLVFRYPRVHRKELAAPVEAEKPKSKKKKANSKPAPAKKKTEKAKKSDDSSLATAGQEFLDAFKSSSVGISGSYYTQQEVPAQEIVQEGGLVLIKLKNGAYVKVLEIESVDFNAEDAVSKDRMSRGFLNFLKNYNGTVQVKITAESPDMTHYNEKLMERASHDSTYIQALAGDIATFLARQCGNLKLNRYYLISSAKGPKAVSQLTSFVECAHRHLDTGGMGVRVHEDEKAFLTRMLYTHYNHPEMGFDGGEEVREEHLQSQYDRVGCRKLPKLHNVIAPLGIDYSLGSCVYTSGLYHQTLYLTDIPRDMSIGWLRLLIGQCSTGVNDYGITDLDLIIQKQQLNDSFTFKLDSKISGYVGTSERGRNAKLEEVTQDAYYIKQNLRGQDFFYFTLALNFHAPTMEYLAKMIDRTETDIAEYYQDMKLEKGLFTQEAEYRMSAPLAEIDSGIFKRYRRNSLDEGVFTLLPFVTTSAIADSGIVFGMNSADGSPVMIDLFNPKPAHTLVIGGTGAGKSFSTMMQMTRARLDGAQVIILTPTKGHEYKVLCEGDSYGSGLDGAYIPLGAGHKTAINVMAITPEVKGQYDESDRFVEKSLLEVKISDLESFFRLAFPAMSPAQKSQLSTCLYQLYTKFGITKDNQSIYAEDESLKPMPLIEDFQKILYEDEILKSLAPQLNRFTTGSLQCFNAPTNVDLDNHFVVLDLTSALDSKAAQEEDMALLINLAVTLIKQRVKSNTVQRKIVCFEEAWMFSEDHSIFGMINEFFRTARSYNCACFCISQAMSDFDTSPALISNCQNFILMKLESRPDAERCVKTIPALNENDASVLTTVLKTGDAIIVREGKRLRTHFYASPEEIWLYETNAEVRQKRYR